MDTESFLKLYFEIETKYFIKKQKNVLLKNLINETVANGSIADFNDVTNIINQFNSRQFKITLPLFEKIIYPALSTEIDRDNINAIKEILRLWYLLDSFQNMTKSFKYNYNELIERGLRLLPNDKELLENIELTLKNYIEYSIHEIPLGVIFNTDGAAIEDCDELMLKLEKYQNICTKLKLDNSKLINEAAFYYKSYKDYLAVYEKYNNYEHYLNDLN